MTTQLQQCREVAAALDEEVTEWRRKDAEWREHRNAAEKALHDMPFVMDNYRAALARAEAAEARVAELAAATAWRPVTEEPPSLGYYLTVDFYGAYGICYYENGEWQSFDYSGYQPTGWRPLPPPPDAATMEAQP